MRLVSTIVQWKITLDHGIGDRIRVREVTPGDDLLAQPANLTVTIPTFLIIADGLDRTLRRLHASHSSNLFSHQVNGGHKCIFNDMAKHLP